MVEKEQTINSDKRKKQKFDYRAWGLLVAFGSLIIGVASLMVAVDGLKIQMKQVGSDIEEQSLTRQFLVTSPTDSTEVSHTEVITGLTPFAKLKHYIVVTPTRVGNDWVQANQVKIFGSQWSGLATFGTTEIQGSERFILRALATDSVLAAGPIHKIPADAIFSDPVIVIRRR
jgi:hypothetical protein